MTLSSSKRSRVTQAAVGENAIRSFHFSAGSPFGFRFSIPSHLRRGPPLNLPCTSMVTSPWPRSLPGPAKQASRLPPRMPSHTALVALLGLPSRISLMVNPLPMPCSTRSRSRKFDLPLAFAPTNRFIRPRVRSTRRRLLKFSTTMRSIIPGTLHGKTAVQPPCSRSAAFGACPAHRVRRGSIRRRDGRTARWPAAMSIRRHEPASPPSSRNRGPHRVQRPRTPLHPGAPAKPSPRRHR